MKTPKKNIDKASVPEYKKKSLIFNYLLLKYLFQGERLPLKRLFLPVVSTKPVFQGEIKLGARPLWESHKELLSLKQEVTLWSSSVANKKRPS